MEKIVQEEWPGDLGNLSRIENGSSDREFRVRVRPVMGMRMDLGAAGCGKLRAFPELIYVEFRGVRLRVARG